MRRFSTMVLTAGLFGAGVLWAEGDFHWSGAVAAGKEVRLQGINGPMQAVAASGNQVEVTAVKSGKKSRPEEVRIDVVPGATG